VPVLPGGTDLFIESAAYLRSDHHSERILGHVLPAGDQIPGHLLGVPERV